MLRAAIASPADDGEVVAGCSTLGEGVPSSVCLTGGGGASDTGDFAGVVDVEEVDRTPEAGVGTAPGTTVAGAAGALLVAGVETVGGSFSA